MCDTSCPIIRPRESGLDPALDDCNLIGLQLSCGRHLHVARKREYVDETTMIGVPGFRGWTAITSRQNFLPSFKGQAAGLLFVAMAGHTLTVQQWSDFFFKEDQIVPTETGWLGLLGESRYRANTGK